MRTNNAKRTFPIMLLQNNNLLYCTLLQPRIEQKDSLSFLRELLQNSMKEKRLVMINVFMHDQSHSYIGKIEKVENSVVHLRDKDGQTQNFNIYDIIVMDILEE